MHFSSLLHRTQGDQIYLGICVLLTHDRWSYNISYVITNTLLIPVRRNYFVPELQTFKTLISILILIKAC